MAAPESCDRPSLEEAAVALHATAALASTAAVAEVGKLTAGSARTACDFSVRLQCAHAKEEAGGEAARIEILQRRLEEKDAEIQSLRELVASLLRGESPELRQCAR
eukprot:SAG11_NODE_8480_length_1010_cov_1.475302_1_plen_106_part_00